VTPYRVGVTGSRDWYRPSTIRAALAAVLAAHPDAVLISGHAREGADMLAERAWADLLGYRTADDAWHAGRIERHPADWAKLGRAAGYRRNAEMVASGADEWAAFARACAKPTCPTSEAHASHGTADCAQRAEKVGIPVTWHRYR
jgi:hypothetical protein